jgi:hypothetical protein
MEDKKISKNLNQKIKNEDPQGINRLSDPKLKETLLFIKSKGLIKINYDFKAESETELEYYLKEEISNFLNDRYNDVHEKVSELRKKGKDLKVITFKIMQIPLKIKTFLATCERKDFERILQRIGEIEKEVEMINQKMQGIKKT